MLPSDVLRRLLDEGDIVGLLMSLGGTEKRKLYFKVESAEKPIVLGDFSLGAANALAVAGTGWDELQDSSSRYLLEPEYENIAYQFFFGVSPAQAYIYRAYPANALINSLVSTLTIGGTTGFIDGHLSPYRSPSALTEMWSLNKIHPAFLGYHPYAEPSSITVRLNVFVMRYDVSFLGIDPRGDSVDNTRRLAPEALRAKATVRTVGGHQLVEAPMWVQQLVRS